MAKPREHILIGIDIGSTFIRGVVTRELSNMRIREVLSTYRLPTDGVDKGNITDIDTVADTITSLVSTLKRNGGDRPDAILIALGGSHIHSTYSNGHTLISRGDGTVSDIDIEKALKDAEKGVFDIKNKVILHTIPLRFKLDGQEVSGNILGLRGHKLEVKALFITYPKQYFATLSTTLEKTNLSITDIIAGPIAEGVPLLSKKQKMAGTAVINIGGDTTSILVYENNLPLLVSVLPVGGNDITKDIALGLKVSLDEAEDIKCGTTTLMYSKRRVDEIIEARIEDICEKINKELERINRKELLPAGMLVIGDSSLIPRIEYMMRYTVKLPVKVANNELLPISNGTLQDSSWARAYGLTLLSPEIKEHVVLTAFFVKLTTTLKRFFVQFLP